MAPDKYRSITRRIGPYSKDSAIQRIDGRSSEAIIMNRVRDDLVRHCGGKPSVAEEMIISMVVVEWLRLRLLVSRIASGDVSDRDIKMYDRLQHSVRRSLISLGLKGREAAPQDLRSYLEDRR